MIIQPDRQKAWEWPALESVHNPSEVYQMDNTVERPSEEAKPRAVTFKVPLDETENLADIGILNAVNWMGTRFNYDMTIEFVSYETQKAITEATVAAIPVAADLAEVVADRVTDQLVNHDVGPLPDVEAQPQLIDFPHVGEEKAVKIDPEAMSSDWTPKPARACYTAQQTADKLGMHVRSLHTNQALKQELEVQQSGKNCKLLFPKCKVNAYRKAMIEAKKNGLVLAH